MSNPIDITSGTNTRVVFKESLQEHHIWQFDTHKHHHVWENVIMSYPSVEQVVRAHSLFSQTRTNWLWWIIKWAKYRRHLNSEELFDKSCWKSDMFRELYLMMSYGHTQSGSHKKSRLWIRVGWTIQCFIVSWWWEHGIGIRGMGESCIRQQGWWDMWQWWWVACYQGSLMENPR